MKARLPRGEGTWEDQFLRSLMAWSQVRDRFKDAEEADTYTAPVDRRIEAYRSERRLSDHVENGVLVAGLRALLHNKVQNIVGLLEQALPQCESAIEPPMLLALTIVGGQLGCSVFYVVDGYRVGPLESFSHETLSIEPQAQLGEYRVDFLLTLDTNVPDDSVEIVLPDGRKTWGSKDVSKKLVVECDGFEFHDRTKEQAMRDRARDRALQSLGYLVFRYTGSDIWSHAFKCAYEAVLTLYKEAWGFRPAP